MAPPTNTTDLDLDPATLAIHGDDWLNSGPDVAPALHVSTTFRYPREPSDLVPGDAYDGAVAHPADVPHIYSRLSAPNTTRLEALLSALLRGRALTYGSGLAAFHALLVHLRPNVLAIGRADLGGYHGCHGVAGLHTKMHGLRLADLHADDAAWDAAGLGEGDLVHVETPLNPTGEAYDIAAFAARAHARGALLSVDSTFAPPGLQDPFALGADVVMHSGTKYIGGHSDLLCGVLAVPEARADRHWGLWNDRVFLGSAMGSLEGWLGVRSLRTLELRVRAQSANAERIVRWLRDGLEGAASASASASVPGAAAAVAATVERVAHASLQADDPDKAWLRRQMPNGFGPVFALWMRDEDDARRLPSKLHLFHHATSLGGVESLVEWRRMSDKGVSPKLLRFSIGAENWEDLRNDLAAGFEALAAEKKK